MYSLRRIWKPELFQGAKRTGSYFEGWYFKCISRDENEGITFIPGIALSGDDTHAFLQIFDGKRESCRYVRYPAEEFSYSKKTFSVRVGSNRFSSDGLELDLETDDIVLRGKIDFGGLNPWPVRLFSPGAMGWYAFVPKMEDYHGVVSFFHSISGKAVISGREIEFEGGSGYIEKDWGTSFPSRWIWLQSNNFGDARASLSLSVATIPWRKRHFTGYIIGFWLEGRLFSFSTYSGGVIENYSVSGPKEVELTVTNRKYSLHVSARKIGGTKLVAPVKGAMVGHVNESLRSTVYVELSDRKRGETIFSGEGTSAGIELHGDIEGMLSSSAG